MRNPPKIRIVCSHCRSESVTRDANASWNPDTQDWELEGVMDAAYCNDCGGECSLEEVPYRPRREITAAGFNGGTDATDARVLWVEADSLEQIEQAVDGLNSDFAMLHEDLAYGDADMLSEDQLKAAAGCVLSLMRIQNALNSSPKWNADTLDAVAAEVRAAGLPLLDAEDAMLNAEGLEEKYSPTGGGEHPLFKREDWRTAVNSDDTLLGYWGWVVNQLNQE